MGMGVMAARRAVARPLSEPGTALQLLPSPQHGLPSCQRPRRSTLSKLATTWTGRQLGGRNARRRRTTRTPNVHCALHLMHLAPPRSSSPPRPHSCSTTPPPRWRLSSSKSPRPRRRWTPTHAPAPAEQPESATPAASAEVMHAAASVAAASLLGPSAGDDIDLDAFLHDLGVDKPQPAVVDASTNTQDTPTSAAAACQIESLTEADGEVQQDCRAARKE
ncbi:hypothetical protein BJ912DRAFT_1139572, partial [Pholiota molesta]